MKDKVAELRDLINQKKAVEDELEAREQQANTPEAPAGSPDDQPPSQPAESSASDEVAALQTQIEELKQAAATQKDMFLRQMAETENFKKRLQKEQDELKKYAIEKVLTDLLPTLDSLEMTLSHVKDESDPIASGVQLTLKQFLDALEKHSVEQISGEGEAFDPNRQEAIGTREQEGVPSGHVVEVHRKGYALHGKIIRAAMVTVSP